MEIMTKNEAYSDSIEDLEGLQDFFLRLFLNKGPLIIKDSLMNSKDLQDLF